MSLLNQEYVPFSAANNAVSENITGNDSLFTDLLERAMDVRETPILQGGKAEIDKSGKLFEMCQEFESFLLKTLIKSMRNTVQKSDLVDTGYAGQFYEDMLYDEYTKSFSKNAGFGFAEMAYLELTGQRGKTISKRPDFHSGSIQ